MPFESIVPPLALRVGITGHRWRESHHAAGERLDPSQADSVRATLRLVLDRIRTAALAVSAQHPDLFATREPSFALVSALAEGADELAASVAVEPARGYVLDLVVPYDLATYAARCAPGTPTRALWDAARARLVLDGEPLADEPEPGERRARHEASLIETNRRLVWNCDLIIAVWDGLEARGEAGTAKVIARARVEGLPVIHIDAVNPSRVVLLDAAGAPVSVDDVWQSIDHVVTRLVAPPEPAARHGAEHGSKNSSARAASVVQRALKQYVAESPPGVIVRLLGARIYQFAQLLFSGSGGVGGIRSQANDIAVPWQSTVTAPAMSARREAIVDPAFQRADYYASAYGARHRSTFTTILFFAPFAVACAWWGSVVPEEFRLKYAVGELALLAVLTTFFLRSRRLHFHEKWLDYRLLAERIRHLGFLWPLGRSSPVIRVPTHAVFTDPRPAWVNWWYRAITREVGVPSILLDEPTVRALGAQIERDLVAAQIAYNRHTHTVTHRAEHRLHLAAWFPLIGALLAAILHVLENLHLLHIEPQLVRVLTGIGIIGPALGAAMHGFASQAGFQEVGIRTDASAQQLERFAERLAHIDYSKPLASKVLGDLTLSIADVMGEDLAGWRVDYLSRPVNPPG